MRRDRLAGQAPHQRRRVRPDRAVELTLCADVEIATAERDGDADRGDKERERPPQTQERGAVAQERAIDDALEHRQSRISGKLEDDAAQDERDGDENERPEDGDKPRRHPCASVVVWPTRATS
jgi:hypothetical protein